MGYDLHITKAELHFENEGQWITADEWLEYVESDPELTIENDNGDYFALWNGKSEHVEPWLDWFDGNIYSKNPDSAIIKKMLEVASNFGATVQGDDGEAYEDDSGFPVGNEEQQDRESAFEEKSSLSEMGHKIEMAKLSWALIAKADKIRLFILIAIFAVAGYAFVEHHFLRDKG